MDQTIKVKDWYTDLGVTFTFIDYIMEEYKTTSYPIDRSNNRRAAYDTHSKMRPLIVSALKGATVWDIGIMEWPAGIGFKWHRDNHPVRGMRGTAMNIMLNPPTENNYCEFCDINPTVDTYDPLIHKREIIPYRQNVITIINTREWHSVINTSPVSRYLLTIGFDGEDKHYEILKTKFEKNELFDPKSIITI